MVTKTKGTVLRSMRRTCARMFGADVVERAVREMRSPAQGAFDSGFEAGQWYPVTHIDAFYGAFLPIVGGDLSTVRTIGAKALEEDIGSFYRLLIRSFEPSSVLSFGLKFWRTIYDAGQVTIEKERPGRVVVRIAGVDGFTRTTWTDVLGGIDAMVSLSKAGGKTVRLVAGGDDGDAMSVEVGWDTRTE